MFEKHIPSNTRHVQHFKTPFAATNYRSFALSNTAPRWWNKIVCQIFPKMEDVPRNKMRLKRHVRKFLVEKYNPNQQ